MFNRLKQKLGKALRNPCFDASLAITLAFLCIGAACFRNSYIRLAESVRDVGTSYAHNFNGDVALTVSQPSSVDLKDLGILPEDMDIFLIRLRLYGKMLVSLPNAKHYISGIAETVYYVLFALEIFVFPLSAVIAVYLLVNGKIVNNEHNKDTRPLKAVKRIAKVTYRPLKRALTRYTEYLKTKKEEGGGKYFVYVWLALWSVHFNFAAIFLELAAFLLCFDLAKLYVQIYKLFLDLSVVITFFPAWCWAIIGLIGYNMWRHWFARKKIKKIEKYDEEFVADLSVGTLFIGKVGTKKTTSMTDIAITLNKRFRDKAYELLIDHDLKFPDFPWINLELCIKSGMERGAICNLATCRQFILRLKMLYQPTPCQKKFGQLIKRQLKKCYGYSYGPLFGYDSDRYGDTCYDNLAVNKLFDVLETYAQLYFIYIVSSSLLISNYAVRIDDYLEDEGNFPKWNADFFRRDPKEIEKHTRYSHRLDFDAIRLGTRFVKDNQFKDSVDFGIILVTEIGKERGNQKTIKFCYAPNGADPENDLMSLDEKLVRHRGTVANFPFVAYLADEQRAASLNLNEQELFDVCRIQSSTDFKVVTNLFALDALGYLFARKIFEKFYKEDRYYKGNNSLLRHTVKSAFGVVYRHYVYNIYNLYAVSTVEMTVEDMRNSKNDKGKKYKLIKLKIHAGRFDTSCWSAFYYVKTKRSKLGIGNIPEYGGKTATFEELDGQHSYVAESMKRHIL